ncbi:hypothetical protein [Shouchella lonarensis]|uniref:Uncharacterized protein n=1 Tax=Shouchella lonarensis TaxID=1464122 RepID=A0A1G6H0K1_9BACI|nr:hypothetical protein [Shouchella lonarensis]SDB87782.1 hypothetical protein SAMN05421737_102222 [Shouchella lonarensis]
MMKRIKRFSVISVLTLALSASLVPDTAEASTGPWISAPGAGSGCKVRLWTDATTYTKRATTIDFTVEQNGKCGEVTYWGAFEHDGKRGGKYYGYVKGSFKKKTPVKKIKISALGVSGKATGIVSVGVNKKGKGQVAWLNSDRLTIYR